MAERDDRAFEAEVDAWTEVSKRAQEGMQQAIAEGGSEGLCRWMHAEVVRMRGELEKIRREWPELDAAMRKLEEDRAKDDGWRGRDDKS